MGYFSDYPDRKTLMANASSYEGMPPEKVNNHIHSPYSFSAFQDIDESVSMAREEDIKVLGINDFYMTDGHGEFLEACWRQGIFPLLNIELIGISKPHQEKGIRINDPANPGRIYISGKGLAHPSVLSPEAIDRLKGIVVESNRQVAKMVDLLNRWMDFQGVGIHLSVERMMQKHARNLLRERHVAKALRAELEKAAPGSTEYGDLLRQVYGGMESEKERGDIAGVEEELRSRLLKAGSPAFVPENEEAFPSIEVIIDLILESGGIPTYPLLLDGTGGIPTEFESDRERLMESLQSWGIPSVEFIPPRNHPGILKSHAAYFYEKGYVVTFGTEHNTSAMAPLTVSCKRGVPLDADLLRISFNGAAYVAAHQYLVALEGTDYAVADREEMEVLGKAVIQHSLLKKTPNKQNSPN